MSLRPLHGWNSGSGGARRASRGRAWLPSLGALAVVSLILLANFYSLLTSPPDLRPMDPLERLTAMQRSEHLPSNAEANSAQGQGKADVAALAALAPVVHLQANPPVATAASTEIITRSTVIANGESLGLALARLYVHGQAARDVIAAYQTLRDPQKMQAGWQLWARFSSAGVMDSAALQGLVVAPPQNEGITIEADDHGQFTAREGGWPGQQVRQALRCGIVGNLEDSLRRCGEGEGLADHVASVLGDRAQTPVELRTGDELRLVMDKLMDGEHLVRYQRIVAVEVRRPSVAEPLLVAVFFDDSHGQSGFYAPDGHSVEALFLRQPLRAGHQTSHFGIRFHPILHRMKAHLGIDYGALAGTPVFAAAPGTLVSAARAGAGGNMVRLKHVDGYSTEYMHLQKFASGLKPGQPVSKGAVIGFVGSTGRSTGPHLHFGARHNGKYLDPTELADVQMPALPAQFHKTFEAQTRPLLDLLSALGSGKAGDRT